MYFKQYHKITALFHYNSKSFEQGLYVQCILQGTVSMQITIKKNNTDIRKTANGQSRLNACFLILGFDHKTAGDMLGRSE